MSLRQNFDTQQLQPLTNANENYLLPAHEASVDSSHSIIFLAEGFAIEAYKDTPTALKNHKFFGAVCREMSFPYRLNPDLLSGSMHLL